MKQFTLPLQKDADRPIIYVSSQPQIVGLLDTGAVFPVWIQEESLLVTLGGTLYRENVPFGGFGGMTTGNMYELPIFCIGELIYPNFKVIARQLETPANILLPATMFRNLIYEIDDFHHKFNISVPVGQSLVRNVSLRDSNGVLQIFCDSAE